MNELDEQQVHYETIRFNFEYVFRETSVLPTLKFDWRDSGIITVELWSSTTKAYAKVWLHPWRYSPESQLQYVLRRITYGGKRIDPELKAKFWRQILNLFPSFVDGKKLERSKRYA